MSGLTASASAKPGDHSYLTLKLYLSEVSISQQQTRIKRFYIKPVVVEHRERFVEVVAAGDSRFLEQLHVPLDAIRAEMLAQRRKTYRVAAVAVRHGEVVDKPCLLYTSRCV